MFLKYKCEDYVMIQTIIYVICACAARGTNIINYIYDIVTKGYTDYNNYIYIYSMLANMFILLAMALTCAKW